LASQVFDREWYHTIELAPGLETPGWFDTRAVAARLPLPADLTGSRCLDVGTFDGFWAFEMERRGGREVIAIDILDPTRWDWPAGSSEAVVNAIANRKRQGEGFLVAREALHSRVERLEESVYDLDPGKHGTFDFVYVGSLLLHLRDPVRALEKVRGVCTGEMLLVDAIDLPLTLRMPRRPVATLDGRGRPWWWKPNVAGLARMVEAAGWRVLDQPQRFLMPPGKGQQRPKLRPASFRRRADRSAAFAALKGDPHAAVRAAPRV
jgi:tRNA (mo5U34)-methyltransferase